MFHQTILNLDDISFLKAVVLAFPETKYMVENALESASVGQARESNLAYQIFNADEIQDAWAILPKNVRAILINELNISGQENEY